MTAGTLQDYVIVALAVAAFVMEAYALIDATRTRSDAFVAAGKLTKQKWVAILAVAAAFGFISLPIGGGGRMNSLGFLSIVAVVASAVYLVDVKPAVRQIRGGGSSGPYGPW
ncbi:MAG: DUF2516 family protein [Kineosporiaceae bacterium]